MEIILSILPWIFLIGYFSTFYFNVKNKIKKIENEQRDILINANKKIKTIKLILIIVMIILSVTLYFGVDLLKVKNDCVVAAEIVEVGSRTLTIESINNPLEKVESIIKLPLDIMVSFVITYYIFLIYIEKSKAINEDERKILVNLYSGRAISGIVIIIINAIYKVVIGMILTPAAKPIIYLYPKKKEKVNVKVSKKEILTHTYPKYNDGWNVIAEPDGTLEDDTGRKYYALYWEGLYKAEVDKSKGFCVKGEDTIKFLEEKLAILGLNEREAQEFIVYWLPQLESNKYNYIYFKQTEEVNKITELDITPKPDSLIRVLMVFKPLNKEIEVEEQELKTPTRDGFTVVEWGGTKI